MAFSILLLAAAWLATAAVALTLSRLIAVRPSHAAGAPGPDAGAPADDHVVVALVPRGRNRVVPTDALPQAA